MRENERKCCLKEERIVFSSFFDHFILFKTVKIFLKPHF
uniref:Uncharacterized protein n=1 Tax=Rhizophora mucronata TaxID=61149 RepID=A0A2P2JJB0_RHIMU